VSFGSIPKAAVLCDRQYQHAGGRPRGYHRQSHVSPDSRPSCRPDPLPDRLSELQTAPDRRTRTVVIPSDSSQRPVSYPSKAVRITLVHLCCSLVTSSACLVAHVTGQQSLRSSLRSLRLPRYVPIIAMFHTSGQDPSMGTAIQP